MEPIINPWLFYLMGTCAKLSILATVTFVLGAGTTAFIFIWEFIEEPDEPYKHKMKIMIITIIMTLLTIVVPSKRTILEMIISKNATPQNIEKIVESVKELLKDEE